MTRDPRMLEEARLGQRIAALPDKSAVMGEGVVVTVVVTIATALHGYVPKAGHWGTLYVRQSDDCLAVVDTGKRVKVAHVDEHAVRAALAVAAGKWQRLQMNGDDAFKRLAVRQAVRMGLGDRLADLSPDLERVRRAEAALVTTERARSAAAALLPPRTSDSRVANPSTPLSPVPRHRPRPA